MWEAVRPFLVIGGFFALVVLGYPISFALALISLLFMLLDPSIALWIMVQRAIAGLDSFVFMAIPFFVLTGKIMDTGGVSERLVSLARPMVGHIRGGLAHVTVVVGMFFAGISGSSTAESATLSTVFIPAMRRRGYDAAFATSLAAAASTMGIIIPPSILMVIYGAVANVSVGAMFIGGFIPGILIGLSLMAAAYVVARRRGYPPETERWLGAIAILHGLKEAALSLLVPVIVVGGIVGGVFTPTEAAVAAALYALLLTALVYRTVTAAMLMQILVETAQISAVILFCVSTATVFSYLLAYYKLIARVEAGFRAVTQDPVVLMLLIVLLFIVLGTFLDATPAVLIFVPVLQPIAEAVGIHPVHMGVVVVMTMALGLLTLPYGLCALTACAIARIPLADIFKMLHLLMIPIMLIIVLCAVFPSLILVLPKLIVPAWVGR